MSTTKDATGKSLEKSLLVFWRPFSSPGFLETGLGRVPSVDYQYAYKRNFTQCAFQWTSLDLFITFYCHREALFSVVTYSIWKAIKKKKNSANVYSAFTKRRS